MPNGVNKSELVPAAPVTPAPVELSEKQIQLLTDTIARDATSNELRLFIEVCRRMNLDPFSHQIYAIKRWDNVLKREVTTYQIGIDGFRLIADRSGKYEGQLGPLWCGVDGKWVDVWLKDTPPFAAKVGVMKTGCREPFWAVATYAESVQLTREGKPNSMWLKRAASQTAKCAEAQALRKAFPAELSGLYANEEMGQADTADMPPPQAGKPPAEDLENVPHEVKMMWTAMQQGGIKSVCEIFATLKNKLIQVMGPGGEVEYYRILRDIGHVEHANVIKRQAARNASLAMFRAIEQAEELRGGQIVDGDPEADRQREPGEGE